MDQQINDQRRQALMQVGELQAKLDFAEKRIAELERELTDAQDYAAELEAKVAELEAEE
jgi:septal ring factor EnvC (AmiA/AmiB activator)